MVIRDLPLVLYGAGFRAEEALELAKKYKLSPVCFCDADKTKHGTTYFGLPVMSFEEMRKKYIMFNIYITVKSSGARSDIINFLYDSGVEYILINAYDSIIQAKLKSTDARFSDRTIYLVESDDEHEYALIDMGNSIIKAKLELSTIQCIKRVNRYTFYVENEERYIKWCSKNYYSNEKLEVKIIDNGIVLPAKKTFNKDNPWHKAGGVCDANGNFIAGHSGFNNAPIEDNYRFHNTIDEAYSLPSEIPHINETVVYGGIIVNQYGHMMVESLARIWWHLENPDSEHKFVFIAQHNAEDIEFKEFFSIIGIPFENIVLIKQPIRFDRIIVPAQSHYLNGPFTEKTLAVYNAIRDSVTPANSPKIYLTKSKFNFGSGKTMNEEYFEKYFQSKGFEIISPETLSIKEKIALFAGAEEIVCTSGTTQHNVLLCQDNVKITVLNRWNAILPAELWINQARNAKCTYISVHVGFINLNLYFLPIWLLPTVYWQQYLRDMKDYDYPCDYEATVSKYTLEFVNKAIEYMTKHPSYVRALLDYKYSFKDFVIDINKHLCDKQLENSIKRKLYDSFPK